MYFIVPAIFATLNVLLIGVGFYLKNVTRKNLDRELEQDKNQTSCPSTVSSLTTWLDTKTP